MPLSSPKRLSKRVLALPELPTLEEIVTMGLPEDIQEWVAREWRTEWIEKPAGADKQAAASGGTVEASTAGTPSCCR
eukprot:2631006-Rhodomonas_salina.1